MQQAGQAPPAASLSAALALCSCCCCRSCSCSCSCRRHHRMISSSSAPAPAPAVQSAPSLAPPSLSASPQALQSRRESANWRASCLSATPRFPLVSSVACKNTKDLSRHKSPYPFPLVLSECDCECDLPSHHRSSIASLHRLLFLVLVLTLALALALAFILAFTLALTLDTRNSRRTLPQSRPHRRLLPHPSSPWFETLSMS